MHTCYQTIATQLLLRTGLPSARFPNGQQAYPGSGSADTRLARDAPRVWEVPSAPTGGCYHRVAGPDK